MAISNSLTLNGSSQYGSIAVSASDPLDLTGAFYVRYYFKMSKPAATQYLYARWGATDADRSYMLRFLPSGGDTYCQAFFNDGGGSVNNSFIMDTYVTWGSWNVIEVLWTPSGNIVTKFNDTLRDTTDGSANASINSTSVALYIGKYYNATGYLAGNISTINLAAQDSDPFAYNLNLAANPIDRYANLKTDWKLDNNALDSAGSNDLTLTGSPTYAADVPTLTEESTTYTWDLTTAGSFTLTGNNINWTRMINWALSAGSFTLTGIDILWKRVYNWLLQKGTFTLTGIDILWTKTLNWTLSTGSFTLTGINISWTRIIKWLLGTGSFIVSLPIVRNISWINEYKNAEYIWMNLLMTWAANTNQWQDYSTDYTNNSKSATPTTTNQSKSSPNWTNQ